MLICEPETKKSLHEESLLACVGWYFPSNNELTRLGLRMFDVSNSFVFVGSL